ncbi:Uncharacterized protein TCM_022547 [Theobroma cacao]|uniref:Uncharacterized protein n=1 Tax=Theobroma cacao TaxID=3641 RepID=A0A061ETS3_THECC|nr:Uncharacterized protein TCM_022547 [Theobroma cacao]
MKKKKKKKKRQGEGGRGKGCGGGDDGSNQSQPSLRILGRPSPPSFLKPPSRKTHNCPSKSSTTMPSS